MSDYINSPGARLAVAFPPQLGLRGACTALRDLACDGDYFRPHYMSRLAAALLIFRRNLDSANSSGSGNRAARREAALALAAMPPAEPLSTRDVDILAERHTEGRIRFGAWLDRPIAINFHD